MRKKKVWRYWCEHCGKGGCGGHAIGKHERACIRNPARTCGMCRVAEGEQKPMADLIASLVAGGLQELRQAAGGCPACMLAAIVQERLGRGIKTLAQLSSPEAYEEEAGRYGEFDYKKERDAFWRDANEYNNRMDHGR